MPAQVGRGLMLCRNQEPAQSTEIRVLRRNDRQGPDFLVFT